MGLSLVGLSLVGLYRASLSWLGLSWVGLSWSEFVWGGFVSVPPTLLCTDVMNKLTGETYSGKKFSHILKLISIRYYRKIQSIDFPLSSSLYMGLHAQRIYVDTICRDREVKN